LVGRSEFYIIYCFGGSPLSGVPFGFVPLFSTGGALAALPFLQVDDTARTAEACTPLARWLVESPAWFA
jgi:hypothetical protein